MVVGPTINETTANNDSRATAQAITVAGTTVNATISANADVDFFRIDLPVGKTLTASMMPNATSDYDVELQNSTGGRISQSVAGTGAMDSVTRTNSGTAVETLYVRVYRYGGGTGATNGKYTLKASW